MLSFIKKQSVGTWVTLGAIVLCIVAFSLYGANVSGAGYFNGSVVSSVVTMSVLSLVFLLGSIVLSQFSSEGVVGKGIGFVVGALKVLSAALLCVALLDFVDNRIEGITYIYFSNPDVLAAIQTPANISSAMTAIWGFVFYGITVLAIIVSAFFSATKEVNEE